MLTFEHPGRSHACTRLPFIALLTRWELVGEGEGIFTGLGYISVWLLRLTSVEGVGVVYSRSNGGIMEAVYGVLNVDILQAWEGNILWYS